MTPISFKSNFISPVNIQKKSKDDNYVGSSASLVEIDVTNDDDVFAVDDLPKLWGNKNFVSEISKNIKQIYTYADYDTPIKAYAVTLQSSHFEKLKPNKILGIVQLDTRAEDINELDYLQVNPKYAKTYCKSSDTRSYKGIGSSLLDSIKNIYPSKKIHLTSAPSAVEFYKNNAFVQTKSNDDQDFIWNV